MRRGLRLVMTSRHCRDGGDAGAASAEYAGVLFVIAAVVVALIVVATPIGGAILVKICEAFGVQCGSALIDARARELGVPCVHARTDRTVGFDGTAYFVHAERLDADQISTAGDGSATVTLTQGGGVGAEAAYAAGNASAAATVVVGGDFGYQYNFPQDWGGRAAAEQFMNERRGDVNQYLDLISPGMQTAREGAHQLGSLARDSWDDAWTRVGLGPSDAERQMRDQQQALRSADAIQATVRVKGSLTADAEIPGVTGRGEVTGAVSGTLVVPMNRVGPDEAGESFSGAVEWDVGGSIAIDPTGGAMPPILNLGASAGETYGFEVTFSDEGVPQQFISTVERRGSRSTGVGARREGAASGGSFTADATRTDATITVITQTLDLTERQNLVAFNEFFIVHEAKLGELRGHVVDVRMGDGLDGFTRRWSALGQRLETDGFQATYEYRDSGDALSTAAEGNAGASHSGDDAPGDSPHQSSAYPDGGSAATKDKKGIKRGGFGVGGTQSHVERSLIGAVAQDNRYGGLEVPLATCAR
ncbi:MAG: hypothetical protein ACRCTR_07270 [Actinomycetota bacterium]